MLYKPWNAAAQFPIMPLTRSDPPPLGPGLSLFLALESRKTLYLNYFFKVTAVDLVPFLIRCRLWLGAFAGAHSTGIVGGGQSARACPGLAFGYTQICRRRTSPLRAVGITLSSRGAEGGTRGRVYRFEQCRRVFGAHDPRVWVR
jgi:hypothetical protein